MRTCIALREVEPKVVMNFKHLYYFWMVAHTGGVIRAGQRLHIAPQTLSARIKRLEARLGCPLLERSGRNVRLTEAGRVAARYAEEIFLLGEQLEGALERYAESDKNRTRRARVVSAFDAGLAESAHCPTLPADAL
jgi:DNA-binding transcriptional LysR family regulator